MFEILVRGSGSGVSHNHLEDLMSEVAERKLVINLGDINPFEHGGFMVYNTKEVCRWAAPEDGSSDIQVYRFTMDGDDAIADLNIEQSIRSLASFAGIPLRHLRAMARSENLVERAEVYRIYGDYLGYINLDPEPTWFTQDEYMANYPVTEDQGYVQAYFAIQDGIDVSWKIHEALIRDGVTLLLPLPENLTEGEARGLADSIMDFVRQRYLQS
jgi:hypothetical protein